MADREKTSRHALRQAELPFPLLAACFFASGFAGLVYEVVWTRRLAQIFASTTYSVTTVLAAFMAGFGLGSYFFGRRADRANSIGRLYAWIELGIGLYALVSLPLLNLVEWLYNTLLRFGLEPGTRGAPLIIFTLAFPVLAMPAALLGGTLPVLARARAHRRRSLHSEVSRLYGINTVGAALGTALAGLLLIDRLGPHLMLLITSAVNVLIAVSVLVCLRLRCARPSLEADCETTVTLTEAAAEPRPRRFLRSFPILFCAGAVTLTGFLSMQYEIVWTQVLAGIMGTSSRSFTIVLTIFLSGLALGALAYARISRRTGPTLQRLAMLLLGLALWVVVSILSIPALPYLQSRLGDLASGSAGRVLAVQVLCGLLLLLVPTLLLGAALPMAIGILSRSLGRVGRDVGGAYLANTIGCIAGSVLTGFLLVPALGTRNTLLCGLAANLGVAAIGLVGTSRQLAGRLIRLSPVVLLAAVAILPGRWPQAAESPAEPKASTAVGESTSLRSRHRAEPECTDQLAVNYPKVDS